MAPVAGLEVGDVDVRAVAQHRLVAVAVGVEHLELRARVRPFAADQDASRERPAGQVEQVGDLGEDRKSVV